tara:strand:- start:118 stop:1329 length:1212 start_codon:yes stop_codon:yes gene_type:complete
MYIKPDELELIQWEPTSYCNANCLVCPRTDKETMLTQPNIVHTQRHSSGDDIQAFIDSAVDPRLKKLKKIVYNGNIGDAMMHPQIDKILIDINRERPEVSQTLHTNGGGPWAEKFERLGEHISKNYQNPEYANIHLVFSIDGLEDTNHLYRRNVIWKHILKNSEVLRKHKVNVRWRMNRFEHNAHQVDTARQMAKDWGWDFSLNDGTWGGDVIRGLLHKPKDTALFKEKVKNWNIEFHEDEYIIENDFPNDDKQYNDVCVWKVHKEIQIVSDMSVWPCCWTSHYHYLYWLQDQNIWNNKSLGLLNSGESYNHLRAVKQWEQLMNTDKSNSYLDLRDIKITKNNLLSDVLESDTFKHIDNNLKTDKNKFNLDVCIDACRHYGNRTSSQVPEKHKTALEKVSKSQ